MNPFLEQNDFWEDFHHNFIARAQEMLSKEVSANYIAKVEVRLILHELSADERRFFGRADVGVTEPPPSESGSPSPGVVAAPFHLPLPAVEPLRVSQFLPR